MKQLQMLSLFIEISKEIIPEIDEIDLEYDIRHNQIDFDYSGPVCSDNKLLDIFSGVINKDDGELYQLIERICIEYAKRVKF